jgi:rubrerythrin
MENQERDDAHEDPLQKLAGQVDNYRRQAEHLGRLLSGRALLECPSCGLHEDELADMTRIVATAEEPGEDTGLRFSSMDDEETTWICPGCGLPFSPDPLEG